MATVFELAKLSALAYRSNNKIFRSWSRVSYRGNPNGKGFYCDIYKNPPERQVVVSYRGTDSTIIDWSDLSADIQVAFGKIPHQFDYAQQSFHEAKRIAENEFGSRHAIILTGHSLGGGLASLVSVKNGGLPTVTFNAPGMYRSYVDTYWSRIVGYLHYRQLDTSKLLHIRASGDPVSIATGSHMGRLEEVYVDQWGNGRILGASRYLAQHSIDNLVHCLETKWHYNQPLKVD